MPPQIWASGGGTQSTAVAALICSGRIAPPDLAVIVDTEREQTTTWTYLDAVVGPALAKRGVTLHRVKKSEFATVDLWGGPDRDTLLIPAFTDQSGEIGKLSTYCSNEWKSRVVQRFARQQGFDGGDVWLGISTDEMRRAKKGRSPWGTRFPLLEQRMSRLDSVLLVERMGWPTPPRSSCWMCPNHTQEEWRQIRDNQPGDWQAAVAFDRRLRERDPHAFVHADCVPLDEANLEEVNGVLFGHDCQSGYCYV